VPNFAVALQNSDSGSSLPQQRQQLAMSNDINSFALVLRSSQNRTESHLHAEGYRGYDPYDALGSPLFRLPLLRSAHLPRWGAQQVLKRLPFQIRPLLGIRKGYNPVSLALILEGLGYRHQARGNAGTKDGKDIRHLLTELQRLKSPGFSGNCWGYDFDWEARYFTIPAGTPTIVATGFVTNALFSVHGLPGGETAAELLIGAIPFLQDLHRTTLDDTFCWSYSPVDRNAVLNATMKGVRLCAQAFALTQDRRLLEPCEPTIAYVLRHQSEQGSWPYSIGDARSWSDHFHTCYVLDCLDEYEKHTGDEQYHLARERGWQYYREHFFTEECVPKYYDRCLYPIDATACAQSILTLIRFGDVEQATKVAEWCLSRMALRTGAFKFQIHRRYENRLAYMRWSTAWMFMALSRLELSLSKCQAPA